MMGDGGGEEALVDIAKRLFSTFPNGERQQQLYQIDKYIIFSANFYYDGRGGITYVGSVNTKPLDKMQRAWLLVLPPFRRKECI